MCACVTSTMYSLVCVRLSDCVWVYVTVCDHLLCVALVLSSSVMETCAPFFGTMCIKPCVVPMCPMFDPGRGVCASWSHPWVCM